MLLCGRPSERFQLKTGGVPAGLQLIGVMLERRMYVRQIWPNIERCWSAMRDG